MAESRANVTISGNMSVSDVEVYVHTTPYVGLKIRVAGLGLHHTELRLMMSADEAKRIATELMEAAATIDRQQDP